MYPDLKKMDGNELDYLERMIGDERKRREEDEKVAVWMIKVNGGTTWFRDHETFQKELKELVEEYDEKANMQIIIDKQKKSLGEVESWIDGQNYVG